MCLSSDENREQSSSAPFVEKLGQVEVFQPRLVIFRAERHWCIDQDICTKQVCFVVSSSPIIHELFNDWSWCNEQSYLGEKCLPSLGIKLKTFHFLCRCSNHWATRLGWLNKALLQTTPLGIGIIRTVIALARAPWKGSQLHVSWCLTVWKHGMCLSEKKLWPS